LKKTGENWEICTWGDISASETIYVYPPRPPRTEHKREHLGILFYNPTSRMLLNIIEGIHVIISTSSR
jgi:hypothetical protein